MLVDGAGGHARRIGHERIEGRGPETERDVRAKDLLRLVPGGVERLELPHDDGVGRRPAIRPVAEEHELERERLAVLLEELVHPFGVRVERRAPVGPQHQELLRRDAGEPEGAHRAVRFETRLAEHLGEAPFAGAPVEVHLEEPVLRGDVPLEVEEVVRVLRVHVGDAEGVAQHLGPLLDAEEAVLAVDRRERPVHEDEPRDHDARDEEQRAPGRHLRFHRYSLAMTTRTLPPSTFVPALAPIFVTRPAAGARSSFSIFMASRVASGASFATASPSFT